uniref:Cytochrome c oxidase subunit 3 n=1 Tax=Helorus sp. ZJUH_2016017 TaxID=2491159 RepID=A0A3S5HLP5_9HYME|nr:cytochrome c oxidase subunit 3 [Helorus sp. ZJUH_2016017]
MFKMKIWYSHPYHMLPFSPWPFMISLNFFSMMMSMIFWMKSLNFMFLLFNLLMILLICSQWWRDLIRESTFQGYHTLKIIKNIKFSMILFITSEVFFFISFFWCYFHMFLSPSIEIGNNWPPKNILLMSPYGIPLINTILLISSGMMITWCHHSLMNKMYEEAKNSLLYGILMAILFLILQIYEFKSSLFCLSDSIFGSIFFMLTGFHGIHVIIGTIFLIFNFYRINKIHFNNFHLLGLEMSFWYWHFVDVVWLFLFILIYWLPF